MRNNRGQALVEFTIILPILLLILMAMIDFGNIIQKKYSLESSLDTVVTLYRNKDNDDLKKYLDSEKIKVKYEENDKFTKIILTKEVDVVTPLLNNIISNPYVISVERQIYNE